MLPYNQLLLPLLGGFVFVSFWNRPQIRSTRYEGYKLLLYSSIWGVLFLFASVLLLRCPFIGVYLDSLIAKILGNYAVQYDALTPVLLSFTLGLTLWMPLNLVFTRKREYAQAVRNFGSRLENRLFESLDKITLVSITLKTRKIYIGYVLENINSKNENKASIVIWPILSGYRQQDCLKQEITDNYATIYKALLGEEAERALLGDKAEKEAIIKSMKKIYDFSICIHMDEIVSCAGYDEEIRSAFDNAEFDRQLMQTRAS